MRIAVMGAGAVGCFYGGMLARAGHAVVLIGRTGHVEAVRRAGLDLEAQAFRERVPMQATTEARGVEGARLVLFCVKSTDTESAGAAMAPHLAPDALVLSMQNGFDNAQRLQAVLARPVIPTVVYVAVGMAGPGHVRHHGRGELVLGPSDGSEEVASVLRAAGVPAQVSPDVAGALWGKLIINCAYNALSAITQLPYGRLARVDGVRDLMHAVVDECSAVARAEGVVVPGTIWEETQGIARSMAGQVSSTAQDLARGRPGEIDHLNGYVVRRGRARGISTPLNGALCTIVRALEARALDDSPGVTEPRSAARMDPGPPARES